MILMSDDVKLKCKCCNINYLVLSIFKPKNCVFSTCLEKKNRWHGIWRSNIALCNQNNYTYRTRICFLNRYILIKKDFEEKFSQKYLLMISETNSSEKCSCSIEISHLLHLEKSFLVTRFSFLAYDNIKRCYSWNN